MYQICIHTVCSSALTPIETQGFINFVELPASNKPNNPQLNEEYLGANNVLRSFGEVFSSISTGDRPAPFETSRLMSVLQPYLGKDSKALVIFNVSPLSTDLGITMNTLKYASSLMNSLKSQQMAKRPPAGRGGYQGGQEQGESQDGGFRGGRQNNYQENRGFDNQGMGDDRGRDNYGGGSSRGGMQRGAPRGGMNFRGQSYAGQDDRSQGRFNNRGGYQDSHDGRGRGGHSGYQGNQGHQQYQGNQQQNQGSNFNRPRPTNEMHSGGIDKLNDNDILSRAGFDQAQISQMQPQQRTMMADRERNKQRGGFGGRSQGNDRSREDYSAGRMNVPMDVEDLDDTILPNTQQGGMRDTHEAAGSVSERSGHQESVDKRHNDFNKTSRNQTNENAFGQNVQRGGMTSNPVSRGGQENRFGAMHGMAKDGDVHNSGRNQQGFNQTNILHSSRNQQQNGPAQRNQYERGRQAQIGNNHSESQSVISGSGSNHTGSMRAGGDQQTQSQVQGRQTQMGGFNSQDPFKSPRQQSQVMQGPQGNSYAKSQGDVSPMGSGRGPQVAPPNINSPQQQPFSRGSNQEGGFQQGDRGSAGFHQTNQRDEAPQRFSQNQSYENRGIDQGVNNFENQNQSGPGGAQRSGYGMQGMSTPNSSQGQYGSGNKNQSSQPHQQQGGNSGYNTDRQGNFNYNSGGNSQFEGSQNSGQGHQQGGYRGRDSYGSGMRGNREGSSFGGQNMQSDYQGQQYQRQSNFGQQGQYQRPPNNYNRGSYQQNDRGGYRGRDQSGDGGQGYRGSGFRGGYNNQSGDFQQGGGRGGGNMHGQGFRDNSQGGGNLRYQGGGNYRGGGGSRGGFSRGGGNRQDNYRN